MVDGKKQELMRSGIHALMVKNTNIGIKHKSRFLYA